MFPRIIGFAGKMGVGKTTCANIMKKMVAQQFDFDSIAFADKLKQIAKDMGWLGVKNEKGRRLLQLLGTECGRECLGENIWVKHWKDAVKLSRDESKYFGGKQEDLIIFVDDIRFQNEAKAVVDMGGIVFLIERSDDLEEENKHKSEEINIDNKLIYRIINNDREFDNSEIELSKLKDKIDNVMCDMIREFTYE